MSKDPRQVSTPRWKLFLSLGEQLLNLSTAADQVSLIETAVGELLGGRACIWLAHPNYPLPGEPPVRTLPDEAAPELVRQAQQKGRGVFPRAKENAGKAALPITVHDNLLGVLLYQSAGGARITPDERSLLEGLAAHAALAMQVTRQATLKKWRSDQLELVRQVSARMTNLIDLDQLSEVVAGLIRNTFHYDYVAIFTLDADGGVLRFRASARDNHLPEPLEGITLPIGQGISGTAALNGEEVVSNDVSREPRYRYLERLGATRSEVALPLRAEDQVLGVLDVQSNQPNAFHENDLVVLRALADSLALAIKGAQLHADARRRAEQLSTVFEVTRTLNSILDLDELLDKVVEVIQRRFGYPYVHIFTVHSGRRKVFYVAGSGARSQAFFSQGITYDLDDTCGMIPWVARTGQSLLANDVSAEPLYRANELPPAETRAELAVPLAYAGDVLGVLDLQSDRMNAFSEEDRSILEVVAGSIAVAIRNAMLYRSEQWRRQVAESFRDVAAAVMANMALEDLLEQILHELEKNLPCEAAAIWLLDTAGEDCSGELHLAASHGLTGEQISAALDNDSIRAWLNASLNSDEPVVRQPSDPYGPLGQAMGFPTEYSSISAPMRAGGRCLGAITLAHSTAGRYGSEARSMISVFASYAAVAIQNSQFLRSAQQQAWVSTVLLQVAEATQNASTVTELLATIARLAPLLLGVQRTATFLWVEFRQQIELSGQYGFDPPLETADHPALTAALESLRASRGSVRIEAGSLPGTTSGGQPDELVLLPLLARDQVLGALLVGMQPGQQTNPADGSHNLAILQGIAHQTSVSLENIRLLETRQEEAYVTAVLLQVAQTVVNQGELGEVLDAIEQLMRILVGIEQSAIYLWQENAEVFLLASQKDRSPGMEWAEQLLLPGQLALLDEVMDRQDVVACPMESSQQTIEHWKDLGCIERSEISRELFNQVESWMIGFPLAVKGDFYGVLVVRESCAPPAQRERRMEIINGIAQQISLAVQNDRLQQETVERERLEKEIQLARQIQQTFLPSRIPQPAGWQVAARWRTARQVGGDFYDLFSAGKGRLALVVADVADKGLPAALYMTVTRTLIRAVSQTRASPARVLERVNRLLLGDSPNSLFVTSVFAILEVDSGRLTYANAGHNRPLLRRRTGEVEQLPFGGTALGVVRDSRIEDHIYQLEAGNVLLLFTDGVTETFNQASEAYGDGRLIELLAGAADHHSAEQIALKIESALEAFQDHQSASDDRTLLVIRRDQSPTAPERGD